MRNGNGRGKKSIKAAVKAGSRVVAGPPQQLLDIIEAVRADPLPHGIDTFHKLKGHARIPRASDAAGRVQGGQRCKADGDRHDPASAGVSHPFDSFQRFARFFIRCLAAGGARGQPFRYSLC